MFVLLTNHVYAYVLKAEHISKATWIISCHELANAFQNSLYLFSASGMRTFAQMKQILAHANREVNVNKITK